MKNLLLYFLLPLLLSQCAAEPSGGASSAGPSSEAEAAGSAGNEAVAQAVQAEAEQSGPASRAGEEKPRLGSLPSSQPPQSGQVLTLQARSVEARAGGKTCVDVQVRDFNNLLSMQYTMAWDAGLLAFTDMRNFGLPGLNAQNFGAHRTAEGLLTFVWIDGSLRGVTIPDGSTIFSVCFDVKGQPGQSASFSFTDKPTAFESVNVNEELVQIKTLEGRVDIR